MTYVIGIHYDNNLYLFINITCDYIQTLLIHFIDSTLKIGTFNQKIIQV